LLFTKNIETLTDLELIDLYKRKGDTHILGILYKRYTGFVFAVCMKHLKNSQDSKDAVMQIFEKLFTDLKKHNIENFKPWLYRVTCNHCLQTFRNNSKTVSIEGSSQKNLLNFMENGVSFHPDSEEVLEERISNLEMELCNLSHEQRTCVELFYLKEKSYQEIVSATGYTMNQVKSYIQNGKRNLKIGLTKDGYQT
jgi:RNA polymerase sigma-70 factor (ECF subfamily)